MTARELDGLAPLAEEADWAKAVSRSEQHVLSLVVALKCFQRLGYFPRAGQVPAVVVERVHGCLGLSEATGWAAAGSHRSLEAAARSRAAWGLLGSGAGAVAGGAGDPV